MSNARAVVFLKQTLMQKQEQGDVIQKDLNACRLSTKKFESDMAGIAADIASLQEAIKELESTKDDIAEVAAVK